MIIDQTTPVYTPIKTLKNQLQPETKFHGHSPYDGGEIIWNNIGLIKLINAQIAIAKLTHPRPNQLKYLKVPALPNEGYNQHHHTGPYDGGTVYGAGIHSHLGNLDGGFAFAVYAPSDDVSIYQAPYSITEA